MAAPTSVKVRRPRPPGNRDLLKVRGEYNVTAYAQGVNIMDGASHPVSVLGYADVAAAQVYYPAVTALTDELAWACHQKVADLIATAGKGKMVTPAGSCRFNRKLILPSQLNWEGMGKGNTVIDSTASDAAVGAATGASATAHPRIRHLQIRGGNTVPIGLDMRNMTDAHISDIWVNAFATNCVRLGGDSGTYTGGGWSNMLERCTIESAPTCVLIDGVTAGAITIANWETLRKCKITPNNTVGAIGVDVVNGGENNLIDNDISYATNATAVWLRAGHSRTKLIHNRYEGIGVLAGTHPVEVDSSAQRNDIFIGNTYDSVSQTPYVNDADPRTTRNIYLERWEYTSAWWSVNQETAVVYGMPIRTMREMRMQAASNGLVFVAKSDGDLNARWAMSAQGTLFWYDSTQASLTIAAELRIKSTALGVIGPGENPSQGYTLWSLSKVATGGLPSTASGRRGGQLRTEGATGVQDGLWHEEKDTTDTYRWYHLPRGLTGSKTFDFASIPANSFGSSTTVTVTGAALGDRAQATLSIDQAGVILHAYVSAADTVTVYPQNVTGSAVDLASATLKASIFKS